VTIIGGRIYTTYKVRVDRAAAQAVEQARIDQEFSDMMASMRENGFDPDHAYTVASAMKSIAEKRAQLKAEVVAVMMTQTEFERIRKQLGL